MWRPKHFDYVIAEPNCFVMCSAVDEECPDGSFPVIPSQNNSAAAHFEWLWDRYLVHKSEAKIFWIGHLEGCHDIKHLLSVRPTAAARTAGIVFMDFCVDSMAEEMGSSSEMIDAAASPVIGGLDGKHGLSRGVRVDPLENPKFSRFFSGKTDNWLIQPIVVDTEKYPSKTAYDWNKEARGKSVFGTFLESLTVFEVFSKILSIFRILSILVTFSSFLGVQLLIHLFQKYLIGSRPSRRFLEDS